MGETDIRLTETERAINDRDKNGGNTSSETTTDKPKRRGRPPKTQEKIVSGVVHVTDPKPIPIQVPGAEEKPPKKSGRPPKKSATKRMDSSQIQVLLVSLSSLIAARPGMDVWVLSPDEAKQIADPLCNILAKNEAIGQAFGEHADALALITACTMIFLPKFIMYQATKPKKPKQGDVLNYGQPNKLSKSSNQAGTIERNGGTNDRQSSQPTKTNPKNLGSQLHELIPASS